MYMCHLTSFDDDIKIHTTIILRNKSAINYDRTIHACICMHTCHFIWHIDFYILHTSHIMIGRKNGPNNSILVLPS
jgi:hypothetical protein